MTVATTTSPLEAVAAYRTLPGTQPKARSLPRHNQTGQGTARTGRKAVALLRTGAGAPFMDQASFRNDPAFNVVPLQ